MNNKLDTLQVFYYRFNVSYEISSSIIDQDHYLQLETLELNVRLTILQTNESENLEFAGYVFDGSIGKKVVSNYFKFMRAAGGYIIIYLTTVKCFQWPGCNYSQWIVRGCRLPLCLTVVQNVPLLVLQFFLFGSLQIASSGNCNELHKVHTIVQNVYNRYMKNDALCQCVLLCLCVILTSTIYLFSLSFSGELKLRLTLQKVTPLIANSVET